MSKMSLIGLGWFGEALAHELKDQNEIYGTTRSDEKIQSLKKQNIFAEKLNFPDSPSEKLLSSDVIILNIPPFQDQLTWFKRWKWNLASHVIFISSTSVYGKNTGKVDEATTPDPDSESGKYLMQEENWINTFPHFTIIRFGGLIGKDRHPGKSLSGRKNISGGNSPVNLIHLQDCIGFTKLVIEKKLSGEIFNLVHPQHPTRADYYSTYCLKNQLPLPEFSAEEIPFKIVTSRKTAAIYTFSQSLY